MVKSDKKTEVMIAEFESAAALMKAASQVRDAHYRRFDCHSPFMIAGLNEAMGVKRSHLGFIVGAFAAVAIMGAFALQWWPSSVNYPLVISGKPFNSYQAWVPITFALTVLVSAFASLLGMMALNRLPRYNHPVFLSERFSRFGDNGFFISIESGDPDFDLQKTRTFLESIGGKNLEVVEG